MLVTIIDVENGKHTVQEITDALNARFQQIKARNPRGYLDQFEQQAGTIMLEIAQEKGARLEERDENGKTNYVFNYTPYDNVKLPDSVSVEVKD